MDLPAETAALPRERRSWLAWALAILVVLGAAGIAAPFLLQRTLARKKPPIAAAQPAPAPAPARPERAAINDFQIGPIKIDRRGGPSLVYAVGTVKNTLGKQRFAVKVEIDLLDGAGRTVGTTSDYAAVIEPGSTWQFKALVIKASAASARIAQVREQ